MTEGQERMFEAEKSKIRNKMLELIDRNEISKSSIYIWEQYPGGIGFSKKLFSIFQETSASGLQLIQNCQCEHGCPACVGPTLEVGNLGKESAIKILEFIIKSQ